MKKLLALILTLLLVFGMTACGMDAETEALVGDVAEGLLDAALDAALGSDDEPGQEEDANETEDLPLETEDEPVREETSQPEEEELPEDGAYTTKEDVALYIHLYGHLPDNFITKQEAEDLGWSGGGLEDYAPGKCIGGNRFGNYEGLLPEKEGRTYTECDIDTLGAEKRGAKRIVFSNDGLIYYTDDHYESFELMYGDPEQ